tara:strand:+ start:455 stop:580 length:126 start_codon:yes stop_codon:yes gene_type:complete
MDKKFVTKNVFELMFGFSYPNNTKKTYLYKTINIDKYTKIK